MSHKISLLVRADLGLDAIELVVTGCLTVQTAAVLHEQIARARMLDPASPIRVDLTGAQHIDPDGLDRLRASSGAPELAGDPRAELHLDVPSALPSCPLGAPAMAGAS